MKTAVVAVVLVIEIARLVKMFQVVRLPDLWTPYRANRDSLLYGHHHRLASCPPAINSKTIFYDNVFPDTVSSQLCSEDFEEFKNWKI